MSQHLTEALKGFILKKSTHFILPMALYVTSKNSYGYPLYVGEDLKYIFGDYIESVTQVQADGDELQKSCEILGRQMPNKRVYTFYGDNAREILLNWS